MAKKSNKIYEFKIVLNQISPLISRTIQVPEYYSFWDLHVAIQDAMGWDDCHLHEFKMIDPRDGRESRIGIPDDDFPSNYKTFAGWEESIAEYFSLDNPFAEYRYDFGDDWEHTIKLMKILEEQPGIKYPICIDGERACPPEDCGGVWGYENLLEVIADKNHEEYEDMKRWVGGKFDPEFFDPKKVKFDNPHKRWKRAFE